MSRTVLAAALAGSLLVISGPGHARAGAFVPDAEDLIVNTYTTADQRSAAVSIDGAGGFVVAWESPAPDDNVRARRFDPSGAPLAADFQVGSASDGRDTVPDVLAHDDGSFIVVWRNVPANGERPTIRARRFDALGGAIGGGFEVNSPAAIDYEGSYYIGPPSVAGRGDGSFVVVWPSGYTSNSGETYGPRSSIHALRFDSAAGPVGTQFQVNESRYVSAYGNEPYSEIRPDVAADATGGFVVVWSSGYYTLPGSYMTVVGRRYDSAGQPATEQLGIGFSGIRGTGVGTDSAGRFSVAWSTWKATDYFPNFEMGSDVRARRFGPTGERIGPSFQVSTPVDGDGEYGEPLADAGYGGSDLAMDPGGEFVVVWTTGENYDGYFYGGDTDGDEAGIFARTFSAEADAFGPPFVVNSYTTDGQLNPAVAIGADGRFVVVWRDLSGSDGDGDGIRARRFTIDHTPLCGDFNGDGRLTVRDALLSLIAATGGDPCELCVCDTTGDGQVTVVDMLVVLRNVVGLVGGLDCPPCEVSE